MHGVLRTALITEDIPLVLELVLALRVDSEGCVGKPHLAEVGYAVLELDDKADLGAWARGAARPWEALRRDSSDAKGSLNRWDEA